MTRFAGIVLGLCLLAGAASWATAPSVGTLPRCEDEVLVGRGDFEGGRWTRYECGPAEDNFVEG